MTDQSAVAREIADPIEREVAMVLAAAGIRFELGRETRALDFYLPDFGVHIECKQFATPRSADQLERHRDVLLVQGRKAASFLAAALLRARQEGAEEALAEVEKEIEHLQQLRLADDGGNGGYLGLIHRLMNAAHRIRRAFPLSAQPEEG